MCNEENIRARVEADRAKIKLQNQLVRERAEREEELRLAKNQLVQEKLRTERLEMELLVLREMHKGQA